MDTTMTENVTARAIASGFEAEVVEIAREVGGGGDDALSLVTRAQYAEAHDADEDEARRGEETTALVVAVPPEDSREALSRLRETLVPRGYLPFRIDETFPFEHRRDGIAILRTADRFAPVRFCFTNAANYDRDTGDILARLEDWDRRLGVTVLGAEVDSLYVAFDRLPDDLIAFAEELYDFCPDLLDQGIEVMVDEAFEYLPEEQQAAVQAHFDADDGDEDGKAHRVALQMLADEVSRNRAVSFWWD